MPNTSKKLIYGKGSKGDGVARINGKNTKAYAAWNHMLERCYCPKFLSKKPSYIGCSVCEEWLFFPTFQKWFDENYVEGWVLDKEILVTGNKIYGSNYCLFAPTLITRMFNDCDRGDYPTGVSFREHTGKFQAQLSIDGKLKHLGYFTTVDDAHRAYLIAKKANVFRMANEWKDKISDKLYIALINKAADYSTV